MIPDHLKYRFDGDSGIDVGCHEIDAVFPSGERRTILLRLGAPYRKPEDEFPARWWIRTELENLDSTDGPLSGMSSLDAVVVGIQWIVGRLSVFEEAHHCRYFWKDRHDEFECRTVLSTSFVPKA
jgi:hypothetical protein